MNDKDEYEAQIDALADGARIAEAAKQITISLPTHAIEQLAEAAAYKMRDHMQSKLSEHIDKLVQQICDDAWKQAIFDRAKAAADAYLSKTRTPTNEWGEPLASRKPESLGDQIPSIVEQWLNDTVNDKGERDRDNYGRSRGNVKRLDWMLRQLVTAPLKSETEKAAKSVEAEARKVVAAHVGRFVAEQMVPAIDIKQLGGAS